MNSSFSLLLVYIGVGALGGAMGYKLKIPSGALIGSMLAVIAFKLWSQDGWTAPKGFELAMQVLLGVMIGAGFEREMLGSIARLALPIALSTLALVTIGLLLCIVFTKAGLMSISTGYLGTSPGAMSVLVFLALENKADPTVVLTFHFVRIVFVILTAPLVVKILSAWK